RACWWAGPAARPGTERRERRLGRRENGLSLSLSLSLSRLLPFFRLTHTPRRRPAGRRERLAGPWWRSRGRLCSSCLRERQTEGREVRTLLWKRDEGNVMVPAAAFNREKRIQRKAPKRERE